MQQFAAELLAGRGEVSPVSLVQFAAVIRAGNAAQQRRKDSAGHKRKAPLSERTVRTNATNSGDLLGERLALAGLSLGGDPGRSEEGEGNYSSEPSVHTARAVTMRRLDGAGGLRRRRGISSMLPPRGSPDRVDRQVDEAERQWGRASGAAVDVQVSRTGMRMLTGTRRATSVFGEEAPGEDGSHSTAVEGVAAKEEDEEEGDEGLVGIERDLTPTDQDATSTTVSSDRGYVDDNRSLFLPTSAAQQRARANALFIPALPRGDLVGAGRPEVGDLPQASSASSLSLVPTVFDVRVPTPPPRASAGRADDKSTILPSGARRHARRDASGGRGVGNNNNNKPPGVRRSSGCPEPGVLPGEDAQRPPAEVEAGAVEYDEWSSAEEMGSRYGGYPGAPAPGEDWKARWMRYEGDYR